MHRAVIRPATRLAAPLLLVAALTGCGLQHAAPGGPVRFTFTGNFGASTLATASETLTRPTDARTATARVHPLAPAPPGSAWTLFVHGIAAQSAPELTLLHPGDRVWWDLHPTSSGATLRAAVGAYPEPFVHGAGGKRLPTTVECAGDVAAACSLVRDALARVGVARTYQVLGTGSGTDTLGVVVGTERELEAEVVAALIARGPGASGVFARFTPAGTELQLLDVRGRPTQTLGAGAGLLAATGDAIAEPDWLVTGTDAAGVLAAARVLSQGAGALHDDLAVAVQGTRVIPLPLGVR